ncbi:hypothetical protein C882_3357 [Caenispirillum salinarum AK4]|uniref:Uncharacterized protein n=1 Tax=Caenispirillum salinarum AK4 TaxID=1238182 RepID=K9H5Q9_9PROT|nr:hypothetical protein C882_3357 [Caenispirillum salinarum AK4]
MQAVIVSRIGFGHLAVSSVIAAVSRPQPAGNLRLLKANRRQVSVRRSQGDKAASLCCDQLLVNAAWQRVILRRKTGDRTMDRQP